MKSNSKLTIAKRALAVPLGWPSENLTGLPRMYQEKVIWDFDGPMVDWATPFSIFAGQLYNVELSVNQVLYYYMGHNANMPIDPDQFDRAFIEFARSRPGYRDRQPKAGAIESFKKIEAAGIKQEIWTWAPGALDHDGDTLKSYGHGTAQRATLDLVESLGLFENVERGVRFIRPGAKAAEMVDEHVPLIIEDHPVTAVTAGYAFGQACVMTPEPYNEHLVCPGVLRVDSHAEIADAVIYFFEQMRKSGALLGRRK